jgi:hypothetical protein
MLEYQNLRKENSYTHKILGAVAEEVEACHQKHSVYAQKPMCFEHLLRLMEEHPVSE